MPRYTHDDHARIVLKMLSRGAPCSKRSCPYYIRVEEGWLEDDSNNVCIRCRTFLGIGRRHLSFWERLGLFCPCIGLGEEEAIKRTWLALEKKGYLE